MSPAADVTAVADTTAVEDETGANMAVTPDLLYATSTTIYSDLFGDRNLDWHFSVHNKTQPC